MSWSSAEQIIVALLPKFSSVFSLFGSGWIMIEVLTDDTPNRPKRNHPYHRLLFAMSFYDVLESVWNFGSSWPIPKGTENIAWARGTTGTCSAQGFFLQFSVAVPIYNAMLSLYYVLVIKYRFKDEVLRRRVEPTMHAVAFTWAFGTAFYSAITGLLNNANLWCWIAEFPAGCLDTRRYGDEATCTRGDNAWIYRWAFYFAPLWFCIFSATVFTVMVFFYVRSIDKTSAMYRNPEKRFSYLNTQVPESTPNTSTCGNEKSVTFENSGELAVSDDDKNEAPEHNIGEGIVQNLEKIDEHGIRPPDGGDDSGSEVGMPSIPERTPLDDTEKSNLSNGRNPMPPRRLNSREGSATPTSASSRGKKMALSAGSRSSVRALVDTWKSSRIRYRSDYKRTLEVYHQALYYMGTFYLTHVWSTSNRLLQFANGGNSVFVLTAIHSFFDPLQGFLNYLVYQRPRYLRIRKQYPKAGRIGALTRMLRFSYMKDPPQWADQESTRFGSTKVQLSGYRASTESKDRSREASEKFKFDTNADSEDKPAVTRMTFAGMQGAENEPENSNI